MKDSIAYEIGSDLRSTGKKADSANGRAYNNIDEMFREVLEHQHEESEESS